MNDAGVPLVGIPLLPEDDGYYFTVGNAARTAKRSEQWKSWSPEHGLRWDWVGLDIEPDASFYRQIMDDPKRLSAMLLPRLRDHDSPRRAQAVYAALIDRIHADGWRVENYQFPLIAEERRARSTFLQRLFGLVDVRTDREVWMLYTSFMRTVGPGLPWSYGPEADAIGVGTTGGPDIEGHPQMAALSWEEFAPDLRLARCFTAQVYIYCLEVAAGETNGVVASAACAGTASGGRRPGRNVAIPQKSWCRLELRWPTTACENGAGRSRSRSTSAKPRGCQSHRSRSGSGARRPRSRPTSTTDLMLTKGPVWEREAEPGGRELRSHPPAAASRGDVLPRRTLFCARLAVQHRR